MEEHYNPEITPRDNQWMEFANCKNKIDIMFPDDYAHRSEIERAKLICRACVVINECKEYSLKMDEIHGIWGGMTPADRRRYRKQQQYNINLSVGKQ